MNEGEFRKEQHPATDFNSKAKPHEIEKRLCANILQWLKNGAQRFSGHLIAIATLHYLFTAEIINKTSV